MVAGGPIVKGLGEFKELIKADKPVFIDFSATWCGPCKVISPHFNKLAEEHSDKATFLTIDVDEEEDIAQEVGIRAMPTFMIFKNGEKIDDFTGADPAKLKDFVAKHAA